MSETRRKVTQRFVDSTFLSSLINVNRGYFPGERTILSTKRDANMRRQTKNEYFKLQITDARFLLRIELLFC